MTHQQTPPGPMPPPQPQQGQCADCRNVQMLYPVGGMWRCQVCADDWTINNAARQEHKVLGILGIVFGSIIVLTGLTIVPNLFVLVPGCLILAGGIVKMTW